MLVEIEIYINLKIKQNVTKSDIVNFDNISPLENQVEKQEMKDSCWRFDETNSMILNFFIKPVKRMVPFL